MANEASHRHYATGDTLYFTIRNVSRQMWNTASTPNFETLTVANWGDYDVAMTESPASSYFYVGTFPAISGNMVVGWYWVDVYKRAGGSPAISDVLLASYWGYWDGTTFKWWGVDTTHWGGTLVSAANVLIDGAITAAKIASDAFTLAKFADGCFSAAKFASGAFDAVWSVATRILTAGTNIVLAKGTGVTGFNDLDAAGVRSAVGLGSANLDTQLGTLATSSQLNSAVWAQTRFRFSIPESVEIPESGSAVYTIGINTYNASGVLTDLDSSPTVNAFFVDGSSANTLIGSSSHPGTGLYELDLTIPHDAVSPNFIRFVGSGEMSAVPLGMTDYTWLVDDVSPAFAAADRAKLEAIYGKLPSKNYLAGTTNSDGDIQLDEATGATTLIAAIWDALASGLTTVGSIGKQLVDNINTTLSSRSSQTSVDDLPTNSELSSALAAADDAVLGAISALNNLSSAQAQTAAAAALAAYDPPTRTEVTADKDEILEAVGEIEGGGGGGGDCPTVDQIGEELETRFSGRAMVIPSPLGGCVVQILGGSDYDNEAGYLFIPKPAGATWPDLSTGQFDDIRFVVRIGGEEITCGTGEVVTPTGADAKVKFSFTHDETMQLMNADGENDVCTVNAYKDEKRRTLLHRPLDVVRAAWADDEG